METESSKDKSSDARVGCVGKFLSLIGVIILFGALGWVGTKFWLARVNSQKIDRQVVSSPDDSTNNREWERKSALVRRRSQLGIDYSFFNALVNQLFWQKYPQLEGKTLTRGDHKEQTLWDELAEETLGQLSHLSEQARGNLGKYGQQDNALFIQQANQLHLSSTALHDLADGQFSHLFPNQQLQIPSDKPLGQVWQAIVFDLLTSLQSGTGYEEIPLTLDNSSSNLSNTLQPGDGQAYVTRLNADRSITITLEADPTLLFSVYSPSGKLNILEDSTQRHWTGILRENGYYEITLVSFGQTPLQYRLQMTIDQPKP